MSDTTDLCEVTITENSLRNCTQTKEQSFVDDRALLSQCSTEKEAVVRVVDPTRRHCLTQSFSRAPLLTIAAVVKTDCRHATSTIVVCRIYPSKERRQGLRLTVA
jgi:hypothetical protein